jgi:hypothetical protein
VRKRSAGTSDLWIARHPCKLKPEGRLGSVTRLRFRRRHFAALGGDGLRRLGRRRGVALQHANRYGDGDKRFQRSGFRLPGIHCRPLRRDLVLRKALAAGAKGSAQRPPKQALSNWARGAATPRSGTRSCLPGMLIVSNVPDFRTATTFGSAAADASK